LPVQVQGEILGILHLQSKKDKSLDESQQQLAYIIVEQIGMALFNLKLREALREQSIRDPLTGLYNRRYMEETLKQQMSRVTRQLHPLGIIMIDIDHFKKYNDTYGHATACRYGGEEFTLIMPEASLDAVQQRAEELRHAVRSLRLQGSESDETITLSVGIALYPQHGRTIENVLHAADSAMYRAKKEGRDRVMIAENVN
jgi:GGDEF domain-containing protein